MMCHKIGRPPISTIGFGFRCVSSESRVPRPPASRTAFIRFVLAWLGVKGKCVAGLQQSAIEHRQRSCDPSACTDLHAMCRPDYCRRRPADSSMLAEKNGTEPPQRQLPISSVMLPPLVTSVIMPRNLNIGLNRALTQCLLPEDRLEHQNHFVQYFPEPVQVDINKFFSFLFLNIFIQKVTKTNISRENLDFSAPNQKVLNS